MASSVAFILILAAIAFQAGLVCGQTNNPSVYTNENPIPVGSNVTLFSTSSVTQGVWLFNTEIIVLILPVGSIIPNTWRARVTFNSTSSSLSINSLTESDSGVYTLDAINLFKAQLTLSVQVPISNVTLTAKATSLVEFNDTAVFTCSISNGSLPSYVWMNGSSELTHAGNLHLSNGNTTLTIVNVSRYDEGPFTCNASNGVSYQISPPIRLNISYGPSNAEMAIAPVAHDYIYRTGSNMTLTCSAESSPPALIMWMINDVHLNLSGPQLQLQNVTGNNSANYKCLFYNTVTLRFSSASVMISIMDPLAAALLYHINGPAIINKSFTLYCNVTGAIGSIQWWKNGQLISSGNTTFLINKTLNLNPVQQSDGGIYQCQAINAVSNVTSGPYNVEVNYGPEMPTIMGPDAAITDENITLTCHASSFPPSSYTWSFNGSLVANTSQYVTPPLTTNMTGIYTCTAYNYVTGLNSSAHTMLTVVDRIKDVRVNVPNEPAIEGFPYMLTCSVTGPANCVHWLMNGQLLLGDNQTDVLKNNTIYFNPAEQNDTGSYQCVAMNAAENVTSTAYMLLVNFGPDMPLIEGPDLVETGKSAVFNCSAVSVPPSQMSWWFNDTLVANVSVFKINQLSLNMSGDYTCMAYNNVTGNTSKNTLQLRVIEALTSVVIKNNTVPINSNNFTLTCKVTGSYDTVYWMKVNQTLSTNTSAANTSSYTKNNMLYFTPLTTLDDGTYRCVAKNGLTEQQSPPYNLLVNYGPLNVTITGPDSATLNSKVSLTCSANSLPNCEFQWYFSSSSKSLVVSRTGPVVTFVATYKNQGNYTCEARNPVTNITVYSTAVFTVTVSGHASTSQPAHAGPLVMFALLLLVPWN